MSVELAVIRPVCSDVSNADSSSATDRPHTDRQTDNVTTHYWLIGQLVTFNNASD